jgi:chromosome segregation protein
VYLKTLTLKGFKSFAETTVLDLEPGITVIVGPNGSGKSNVVDAVAWVLGAQGPSTLRSQRMEDVIFAGSGGRPALGRAEVSLTIDNSDGRLPVGFAEVTVTRTLWRSGESEYAINGSPCRLLDISELLSDSGVGRSQHVIVSQGGLDRVLSARPEERRLMIEEAAGILKFRRRRERTERRIAATAGDLSRLEDLVREVRSQLRPLQRQADAAERHDGLVAEAHAIRVYLAGQELQDAQTVLEEAQTSCAQAEARLDELREAMAAIEEQIAVAETALSPQPLDEHDAMIGALDRLGERARGLAALVGERQRSLRRSLETLVDEGVVAALTGEEASIRAELEEVGVARSSLREHMDILEAQEAELERGHEPAGAEPVPEVQPADEQRESLRHGELRGRQGAMSAALERDRAELARTQGILRALRARVAELSKVLESQQKALEECEMECLRVTSALAEAEEDKEVAEHRAALATSEVRASETDLQAWRARADALAMALDQLRARGGAGHLAGSQGLLGILAELVIVDHGWEAAFEAALGDASASVVFEGSRDAVAALERLATARSSGLVITAASYQETRIGSPSADTPRFGQDDLLAHVSAEHPVVSAVLKALLRNVAGVEGDWRSALALAIAHPEKVFVTRDGDRFGPLGWRVGNPGLGATGAAVDDARSHVTVAADLLANDQAALASATSELAKVSRRVAELARERDASVSLLARTQAAAAQAESERAQAVSEAATLGASVELLLGRVERDSADLVEVEGLLAAAERQTATDAERDRVRSEILRHLEERRAELRATRQNLEVRSAAVEERRSILSRRLAEIEQRLARTVMVVEGAAHRRQSIERAGIVTGRLALVVRSAQERIEAELSRLGEERAREVAHRDEGLAWLRRLRSDKVALGAGLEGAQGQVHNADLARAEARFRRQAAVEALRVGLEVEPEVALTASCPNLPAGVSPEQRAVELARQLRLAGPVNPLALAELEVVKQRSELLDAQLADIQAARADLCQLLRAIDTEMAGVFATAYEDVAGHFSHLFGTLFPGGEGTLCLTDPDNLLETGIEVMARPAGKRVRTISLLSGGERSLVALAFLFAVFRSRPSPFYILDEVEAALDDVNLQRFLDLIHEFRTDAQLVIVSHQRRTMEVADWLYGVSMSSGASSRVVSERTAPSP